MFPRPNDVYMTAEEAADVLAEVSKSLGDGQWILRVPNRASKVVLEKLQESGWYVLMSTHGAKETTIIVEPESERQRSARELLSGLAALNQEFLMKTGN